MTSVVRLTLSLYVWLPVEVMFALITVVPPLSVVNEVIVVPDPIAAEIVVVLVLFKVKVDPPSTVPPNVIAPSVT